eukprot:CAMPEP_0185479418 /NCGR_PEP_ID=MMETSP1366-20130426/5489_1 /TAXON_ID=38817 /ORGANISM="Gephyrocapsa oceanica, Strain RCC1303" /LENGTH=186 /DNA_ID=CAMNT_0028086813 /DNA_START=11 /DNA_END=569 /DNA_ORIENTATION=-
MHAARRVFAAATVAGAAPKTKAPEPAAARRTAAGKGRRGRSDAESSAALTRFADTIASICATNSSENSAATPLPKHRLEMASTEAPSVSAPSDIQAASTYARPERTPVVLHDDATSSRKTSTPPKMAAASPSARSAAASPDRSSAAAPANSRRPRPGVHARRSAPARSSSRSRDMPRLTGTASTAG